MHHPEPAGDSGGVRKMPHPAAFHRRGSGSANPAAVVVDGSSGHVSGDDYQPSLLIQPPAASSSPGPHHHPPPPHSLNLQPQPAQPTGAQIKKKSGFQITSVTPAQISVSTNNSIAEDTESYDDLDESHTEDLSSSEILDVSLSRANDVVGTERSSSEETLNNFHEAETPGAVSPNQPSHPHALTQAQQCGGAIVNGTMHHQQHAHHLNHAQSYPLTGALPSLAQKMPSNVGGPQENVSHAAAPNVVSQSAGVGAPGSVPGVHGSATGAAAAVVSSQTSSVSNVNMLSSANVPVRGGISTSASGGVGGFPPAAMTGAAPTGGSHMSAANVNMIQQQQNINSMVTTAAAAGAPSGIQGRVASAASAPAVATAVPSAAPAPAATAATSRFRVVKLDSSSEPFRKGRWTCAEFYDKDAPADAAPLGSRQFMAESFAGASERESMSGCSVSSAVSTLSHYVENLGSGEAGGSPVPQHAQDYTSPPQGYQGILPSGLNMAAPQSQAHVHAQDINHPHAKTTAAPSAPTNLHQPGAMSGQQSAVGAVQPQQLTYAQAVANQPPSSSHGPVGVQQQKMGYAGLPQQSAASPPRPAEYSQPQAPPSQPLPGQAGSAPAGLANGAAPMMGGHGLIHKQAPTSSMPPHAGVAGVGQQPQSHPSQVDVQQQQQSLLTQIQNPGSSAQLPPAAHQNQASASSVPPPNAHAEHQPQAHHNAANIGRMSPHPSSAGLTQDPSSVQALVHAAQASALYASLPSFTTTQLQDAQRLLLQHQSLLKLSVAEAGPNSGPGQETEGNANTASALTAPAGLKTVDGEDDGSSGASVVAIDNKIEQAMDLVKSHLMYAVREEVEVLKEQIKELIERNSQLEQENTLLKTLASPEQMAQFQAQVQTGSPPAPQTAAPPGPPSAAALTQPASHSSGPSA